MAVHLRPLPAARPAQELALGSDSSAGGRPAVGQIAVDGRRRIGEPDREVSPLAAWCIWAT